MREITLLTTQADFEEMHHTVDTAAFHRDLLNVDRFALERLLIDHSTLVAYCRQHGLKVIEPTNKGRRRVPLKG